MSKEKQIEEMAHEIRCLSYCEGYEDNRGCYIAPTCALCRSNRENNADQISKAIYHAGYRKQSDVAREIFEEIYEDCFDQFGYIDYNALAELKKKYTVDKK